MTKYYFNEDNCTIMDYDELFEYLKSEWTYESWLQDEYSRSGLAQMIIDIMQGKVDVKDLKNYYKDFLEDKIINDFSEVTISDKVITEIRRG